jgi:hypothetical protein
MSKPSSTDWFLKPVMEMIHQNCKCKISQMETIFKKSISLFVLSTVMMLRGKEQRQKNVTPTSIIVEIASCEIFLVEEEVTSRCDL